VIVYTDCRRVGVRLTVVFYSAKTSYPDGEPEPKETAVRRSTGPVLLGAGAVREERLCQRTEFDVDRRRRSH